MTLTYVVRLFILTLLLVQVLSGRGSGWNTGDSDSSETQDRRNGGDSETETQRGNRRSTSEDTDTQQSGGGNGGGRGGGNGGNGGDSGADDDDDDDDTPLVCSLGRTGNFYDGAQDYFGGGGCGCQYGPTRNALRELAAGYLIEFNRQMVDNYGTAEDAYTTGRFERWFFEFATDDVQYATSTGTATTEFDGLDELTDESSGFGYQLATGDLDYRGEISPVIMTSCSADGQTAMFRGLLTIYRIDRGNGMNDECTEGIQQTRSTFIFEAEDDQWLVSNLRFVRDDIPETCS